ncbi:hypothetical protein PYK79_37730, partial [Streptomyces sp. ID05-04B]|nr:hypothetical protein [Streptomyces sp. ID05-04B]
MHPRLTVRGPWLDHCGELPLIHGTLIRLKVDHLPGDRDPKPVWLWSSRTSMTGEDIDLRWQAFLRRFDLEHTFRLFRSRCLSGRDRCFPLIRHGVGVAEGGLGRSVRSR